MQQCANARAMPITIATWNINSVRLRQNLVVRLLNEELPDVLCLQELKSPQESIPASAFEDAGYRHIVARGQKSYNGVAILSRHPLVDLGSREFLDRSEARHIAARMDNGIVIHNFYVPAGGDIPDRVQNSKFGDKLDFLAGMRDWFGESPPVRTILAGDLNIAPREDDVWSHRQLLDVVSHTPVEVELLAEVLEAGNWTDITRYDIRNGKLYTWWSYRARDWNASDRGRRLDHIWASQDLVGSEHSSKVLREARGWERPSDHAPVFATFEI